VPLAQGMQAKLVSNFSSIHSVRKILFVCKNKQHSITQLILQHRKISKSLGISSIRLDKGAEKFYPVSTLKERKRYMNGVRSRKKHAS
jgi:hypothetical protein